MMSRVFVAAILPENIKEKIYERLLILDILFPSNENNNYIRWVKKENLHLTLKYFDEIEKEKIEQVYFFLNSKLKNIKKINVLLQGFSSFKIKNEDKIIWAKLDCEKELFNLHYQLNDFSIHLGYKNEFKFNPHITVARLKGLEMKEKINSLINSSYEEIKFQFENISIIKSKLTPKGSDYKTLYNISLN